MISLIAHVTISLARFSFPACPSLIEFERPEQSDQARSIGERIEPTDLPTTTKTMNGSSRSFSSTTDDSDGRLRDPSQEGWFVQHWRRFDFASRSSESKE